MKTFVLQPVCNEVSSIRFDRTFYRKSTYAGPSNDAEGEPFMPEFLWRF